MKTLIIFIIILSCIGLNAQDNTRDNFKVDSTFLKNNFPKGVNFTGDVIYKTIDGLDLKLDIYWPTSTNQLHPVVVDIHGGAWYSGSKTEDALNSANLFRKFIESGFAVVSIDYRLSQQAKFPAQIQDCNDAIDFIAKNGTQYQIDKNNIGLIGGSAGGHLVALVATTVDHQIDEFYSTGKKPEFKIKAVVDLFGVSDIMACRGNSGWVDHDAPNSAEAQLLGASPLQRPDLAKLASPTTYITKNTPPFLIFHGDKDPVVQYSQSIILESWLKLAGVENTFITVPGAGHGGAEFGAEQYEQAMIEFFKKQFDK